ncbi:type II toxin-antitoxin system PemK/MazF family toxin [Adhaeribacter pallidiroseus]|uniref:Type II toxin-antitoxin system PemK/MazF family toxin n=1 Tax=Adhaeribacter pallidiroseus TaxID=2072847 RepID=A0A369QJ89_9BACT|nr:type II toxin-antitoxin system PemK/MazF family toxin [Adhaeribacter pallidiroseus]RDC63317.1 hypothetical protein AHMF7616_01919 [Adhaeribacter pallidiroseus]
MKYKQGDIVWINFPFTDGSQSKPRPALILSNTRVNDTGDYILVQITSKVRNDGLSLAISVNDYRLSPLLLTSYVRIHRIFTSNEALISSKISAVTDRFTQKVINQLILLLQ